MQEIEILLRIEDKLCEVVDALKQINENLAPKNNLPVYDHPRVVDEDIMIGVISFNREDFIMWEKNNPPSLYNYERIIYRCITKPSDLVSYSFDEIIETEHAKDNKLYEQIIISSRGSIKNYKPRSFFR